jgi:hypothetical protein
VPCRPVLAELLPVELADLPVLAPLLVVCWLAVETCPDPGRLAATAPATTRLARPAAAVTVRTLARLRALAAIRDG